MAHRFFQVDVFSVRAGMGNPLAVVFDAGNLDSARMQAIAAWINLAEQTQSLGLCVFARSPGRRHDLVVRAFPLGVGISSAASSTGVVAPE